MHLSNLLGERVHLYETNPQKIPWSNFYTTHDNPQPYYYETSDNYKEYDYLTMLNSGSASFPLGVLPKANTLGIRMILEAPGLLNIDYGGHGDEGTTTPYSWQNGANNRAIEESEGWLAYGAAVTSLDKLWIYGYTSGYANTDMPTAEQVSGGSLINLNFTGTDGNSWDKTWDIALTSVNIHDEESCFSEIFQNISGGTSTQQLEMPAYISDTLISHKYLKKVKIYMKSNDVDLFFLQAEVDLGSMTIKSSTSGKKFSGSRMTDKGYYTFTIQKDYCKQPNFISSYESETAINQISAMDSNNMYCKFKTATIINNRVYVGNIEQNGKVYSDRVIKSPINKFGILPSSNFIDVAINDGDEIIHLESFKDSILQFKKKKVFVINASKEYEFLEHTLENVGIDHSCQVCNTPKGIVWITKTGCYLWNGAELSNLIDGKLGLDDFAGSPCNWSINHDDIPSVAYLKQGDKLLVLKSTNSYNPTLDLYSDNVQEFERYSHCYMYDFKNSAWTMSYNRRLATEEISNFIYNEKDELMFQANGNNESSLGGFQTWSNNPVSLYRNSISMSDRDNNSKQFRIVTKDFSFEEPATRKKIYKIYITYKSVSDVGTEDEAAANSNVSLYYAVNGQGAQNSKLDISNATFVNTSWTEFPQSKEASESTVLYETGTGGGFQGTTTWKTVEFKPSSSINNIYSFQLKFEKYTALGPVQSYEVPDGFMINDISIVYRKKGIK